MRRPTLILLATLGNLLPLAAAQQSSADIATAQAKQLQELHDRAAAIVREEEARAGEPLCSTAANHLAEGICQQKEAAATEANETKLVRTLGLFYRVHLQYAGTPAKPGPLSFDQAEASWHLFRDQVCQSVAEQYQGGTAQPSIETACRINITRHHIDELWAVYKDID